MFKKTVSSLVLLGVCCTPLAVLAQHDDHHDAYHQQYVHHNDWKKGYHMRSEDWGRGQRVDYRTYHLRRPPRGYEWRQVDGRYVMAAIATGVIADIIINSR